MSEQPSPGTAPDPEHEQNASVDTPHDRPSDDAVNSGGATAASELSDTEEIRREPAPPDEPTTADPGRPGTAAPPSDESGVTQQLPHGDAPTVRVAPVTPPMSAETADADDASAEPKADAEASPEPPPPSAPPPVDAPPPPPVDAPPPPPPVDAPSPPPPPGDAPPPSQDPSPPPGTPPHVGPRRVTRRADDRVLGGVAGGLGDYFNVDPAIFRLIFVALTFAGGTGVMLYALAWVLMPERDTGSSVAERLLGRFGGGWSVAGAILIGIALLIILDSIDIFGGEFLLVAVLIGVGVLLFRQQDATDASHRAVPSAAEVQTQTLAARAAAATPTTSTTPPSTGGVDDPAFESVSDPLFDPLYDPPSKADTWRPTPAPPPPAPPRPPSILGRATVAAALVLVGLTALVANLTTLNIGISEYVALALTVVGAGLVLGAWRGRARGLLVLGVLLAGVMAITATVPWIPASGAGQRTWTPQSIADIRDSYELSTGQLTIDLTQLQVPPGQQVPPIEASLGSGQLVVEVPRNATVDLDAATNLGSISVFGEERDGANVSFDQVFPGPEGSPTLQLELANSLGETEIVRDATEVN